MPSYTAATPSSTAASSARCSNILAMAANCSASTAPPSTRHDGALILRPLRFGRWALFLPGQAQAGAVMLKDARLLETLFPTLPGYAWSLDLLSIDPAYAPDWAGLRFPRIVIPHALTMAVATDGDFASYWQARPKNLITNIRRYQRRAEESAGPLSVTVITDPPN